MIFRRLIRSHFRRVTLGDAFELERDGVRLEKTLSELGRLGLVACDDVFIQRDYLLPNGQLIGVYEADGVCDSRGRVHYKTSPLGRAELRERLK